jgi:hypothetical protein
VILGLLLVATAHADPSAFSEAREMLTSILAEKTSTKTSLCWESGDSNSVILVTVDGDGTREALGGPRGPTMEDTLAMLPETSVWYGADPKTITECPVVEEYQDEAGNNNARTD